MHPQNVSVKFQPTDNLKDAYFKMTVCVHFSLNAKELLLPAPFLEQGCAITARPSDTLLKTSCLVLIIMSIVLKSCVLKPYQLKMLI